MQVVMWELGVPKPPAVILGIDQQSHYMGPKRFPGPDDGHQDQSLGKRIFEVFRSGLEPPGRIQPVLSKDIDHPPWKGRPVRDPADHQEQASPVRLVHLRRQAFSLEAPVQERVDHGCRRGGTAVVGVPLELQVFENDRLVG